MKQKQWENIFRVIANVNSIVKHVIQIKNEIITHVNVSVKSIISVRKIKVGILALVFMKTASI